MGIALLDFIKNDYMTDMTELELANKLIPLFKERLQIANILAEDLIGKKVVSIRGGFSNTGGGQVMKVDSIEKDKVKLISCEESFFHNEYEKTNCLGWSTKFSQKYNDYVLYTKETRDLIITRNWK